MNTYTEAAATRLDDRDYYDFSLASIETARRQIMVVQFLFDIRPAMDIHGHVLELAMALMQRRRLGVDVRVLLCGQVRTIVLGVANVATGILLESYGIPHRRIFDAGSLRTGSHAKFVVCDDIAVVGSQNWTDDGLNDNIEDAVILQGQLVEFLKCEFERLWANAKGLPTNETK